MGREWDADILVGPALAGKLIEEQFSSLGPVKVASFGSGWDNEAYLVNERYIFRFPRRKFAVQFMENEIRVLPKIGRALSLAIPVPEFVGQATVGFPYPFAGYKLISGKTADRVDLSDEDRQREAVELAHFLKGLHGIQLPPSDAPGDTLRRLDIPYRIAKASERLEYARAHRLIPETDAFEAIFASAPMSYVAESNTLVHGDLYSRHLLVGADHRLTGVIDWGDIHRGDAAADLMIIYTFLPPAARRVFLDVYRPVDQLTLRAARFRAAHHTTYLLCFAHETQDQDLLRESEKSVRHLCMD